MKLSPQKRSTLDERYVSYNPDQEVDGPDTPIELVCALHGPYSVRSERLLREYTKRTLRAPQCAGCRKDKLTDTQYRRAMLDFWSIYREGNEQELDEEDYPISPEFVFMEHWNKPLT